LGAFPAPAKFNFALTSFAFRAGIGNEIAPTSAFPSATWERGEKKHSLSYAEGISGRLSWINFLLDSPQKQA